MLHCADPFRIPKSREHVCRRVFVGQVERRSSVALTLQRREVCPNNVQRSDERLPQDDVVAIRQRPLQCRAPVVQFVLSERAPDRVRFGVACTLELLGQFHARERVTASHGVRFPVRRKFLACVLPKRLQKRITGLAGVEIGRQERLVHQRREQFHHVGLRDVVARADGGRGGQRTSAGKHGEALEDALLARDEQIVTPIDRGAHRPLTRQGRALTSGENVKAMVEHLHDRPNREHFDPCGAKFYRERYAV